ncbi:transporter substrate-binding domain-containing protein [Chitinibacter bivalviorum]|uniref:Transporter substrate-binding domain-containing protein n=1 Tax=Chitinibacter bivalviorum TaxID=2739434 RepID=A0A7H9BLS4_9NEIS|nr:transporter substrate-binding domain-containing protein [Chitinibacter bivalviorum]QLG89238.1 transporter substrate-binding domain-containing protein [Chitinibacter bivalviorum]
MKNGVIGGLCVMALLLSTSATACSRPMRMAIEQWPPYIYSDAKGQPAGVDIELARAIFAEAGCSLQIGLELPRKRRIDQFMKGEIDLMLAASDTPERQAFSRFSSAYRTESISLFTLNSKLDKYREISEFGTVLQQKITLLAPNAGWYGDDYKKHYFWLNEARLLSPYETSTQAIKMLSGNRAELLMGDTGALIYEAKLQSVPLEQIGKPIHSDKVSLMLSKKTTTEKDVQILNAAIERLEKNGALKKIRAAYGL